MRRIFLTGATGFLGSAIAERLIRQGFTVTVLVRSTRTLSGEERFLRTMRSLLPQKDWHLLKEHVSFAVGDLSDEGLKGIHNPGNWDAVVHSAASTDFNESNHENLRRSNVDGVHAILRFAKRNEIPSFHQISTAYSCGDVKGRVKEEVQYPEKFRNLYEDTKNQAERVSDSFCRENDIRLTVHRPSIIVGDSKTGRSLNFEGPYLFFKQVHRLARYVRRKMKITDQDKVELGIKLPTFGEDEQNVVPVDYVADFVVGVISREPLEGKIYHITNPNPPTNKDLNQVMKKLLNFDGMHFMGDVELRPEGKLEVLFAENLKAYWPYLKPRIVFDRHNTIKVEQLIGVTCPTFDEKFIMGLYNFALETNFGKKTRSESHVKETVTH